MDDELTNYYFLLGLRPGASPADLKAAHRDLAKVWHPDRFVHDPELRQKAEHRLKEINEAYDQLRSGKAKRRASTPNPERHASGNVSPKRRIRWQLVFAPVLVFGVVFLVASRSLLRSERVEETAIPAVKGAQQPPHSDEPESVRPSGSTKELPGRDETNKGFRKEEFSGTTTGEQNAALVRPMATVTVAIDPTTGMLAREWCPMKTSMTYPSGNQPHEYCARHRASPIPPLERTDAPASRDSRVKSVAKRLLLKH